MIRLMVRADVGIVRETLRLWLPAVTFSVRKGSGSTRGLAIVQGECPDGQEWGAWNEAVRLLVGTLGKVV